MIGVNKKKLAVMQSDSNIQTGKNLVEVKSQPQANVEKYNALAYSIIAFPVVLLLAILAYKRYRIIIRKKRIATLERIWLINIDRKIR